MENNTRRNFLKASATLGGSVMLSPAISFASADDRNKEKNSVVKSKQRVLG